MFNMVIAVLIANSISLVVVALLVWASAKKIGKMLQNRENAEDEQMEEEMKQLLKTIAN